LDCNIFFNFGNGLILLFSETCFCKSQNKIQYILIQQITALALSDKISFPGTPAKQETKSHRKAYNPALIYKQIGQK